MDRETFLRKLVKEICESYNDNPILLFQDISDELYNYSEIKDLLYKNKLILTHNERVIVSKIINEYNSYIILKEVLFAYKSGIYNDIYFEKFLEKIKKNSHLLMAKRYFKDDELNVDELIKKLKKKNYKVKSNTINDNRINENSELLLNAKQIIENIKAGIRISDDETRDFSIVDYYSFIKINPSLLLSKVSSYLKSDDLSILKRFVNIYSNDSPISVEEIESIRINYNIDRTTVDRVLENIYELDIPLTLETFKYMLNSELNTEKKTFKTK